MTLGQFWMEVVLYYVWVFIFGVFFFYGLSIVVFIFFGESLLFKISRWNEQGRRYNEEERRKKRQIKEQKCKSSKKALRAYLWVAESVRFGYTCR